MKETIYFANFDVLVEGSSFVILRSIGDEESFVKERSLTVAQDDEVNNYGIVDYIAAGTGCSYEQ